MARQNKCPAWAFACVSLWLFLSPACSSASSQGCVDGTYERNGATCCRCGAGLKVQKDCDGQNGSTCIECDANTYSSHPNSNTVCEPCTSCDQPNANLEEDKSCTPASDTKCRCKKNHYCPQESLDPSGRCRICHPCTECGLGIKVACTATNNTVCYEGKVVGITVGVLLGIAAIVPLAVYFLRKRNQPSPVPEERLQLRDLQPHLTEIADIIGWKDMKTIALASTIPSTYIEYSEQDNPRDTQQQTLQLLQTWMESQGRNASKNLVVMLRRMRKNGKAERVIRVLSGDSAA